MLKGDINVNVIISVVILFMAISPSGSGYSESIDWEVKYEGGVVPDKSPQVWSKLVSGANKVEITANKELHILDNSNAAYAYFIRYEKTLKTLTLETRVRTESNSDGLAVSLRISDTSNVAHIFFHQKKIELRSGFAAFPESQLDIDMRDYHVIRIVKEGENIAIYIDGQKRTDGKLGTTNSSPGIAFGSISWSGKGESYWDYIRYTAKGAFKPEERGSKKLSGKDKLSARWGQMKKEEGKVRL